MLFTFCRSGHGFVSIGSGKHGSKQGFESCLLICKNICQVEDLCLHVYVDVVNLLGAF